MAPRTPNVTHEEAVAHGKEVATKTVEFAKEMMNAIDALYDPPILSPSTKMVLSAALAIDLFDAVLAKMDMVIEIARQSEADNDN